MAGSIARATMAAGVMAAALAGPVGFALGATVAVGGASASFHRARVIGAAPARQTVHMTVTLRPRDLTALIGYAHAVSTPGTAVYRHYLTPAQFAGRFGAAPAHVALVRRWLRSRGLTPGPLSAGALSIPVTASAERLQHALGISLARLALPGGRRAMAARAAPVVSDAVAGAVQSLVGLDTVSRRPLSQRPASGARLPLAARHVITGGPQACTSARTAAAAQSAYTADQIASAYGFAGPYRAGNRGAGTTVAMYELEPVAASDLAAYQSCYGLHTKVGYVRVDGGAGSGGGSGEAALDIENFISLAPASRVIVYEGPNSNSGNPGSGPYDTFASIINQDRAQVVSVSWGECEAALGATDAQAENTLFAQAAIQGQTIVAAAGDSGSADCNTGSGLPQTQLAVDDPASQPLVTGVGGTTLSTLGPRPVESVWSDAGNVTGTAQPGAGGGGISNFWAMPTAQRTAASSLGVLSAGLTGLACAASSGYCRQVPDVAVNANPATGYLIYWNGNRADPGQPAGWQVIGGTSGGAPVWAAVFALADSSSGCTRSSLGDALPALYRAAAGAYGASFNDVQNGNNDFSATNGGRYPAGPGYDEASGLGTPNAASLVAGLCANALRLQNPGDQTAAAHATVALRLRSVDVAGARIKLAAHGLPPGLRLASGSGLISGVPRRHGRYRVQLTAQDGGSVISRHFVWTIGTPAIVRGSSIAGVTGPAPVLSVTVTAGSGSPPLSSVTLSLPPSLSLSSTRGVAMSSGSLPVPFRAHRKGRSLLLTLRHATRAVTVLVGPRGLAVAAGREPRSVRGASLGVVLTDSSGGISSVSIRPRVS